MDLDTQFQEAFEKISKLKKAVAPDVMLKFYAYYKQANFGNNFSCNCNLDLRNGFKFNAWMQLKGMSSEEAKEEYVKLANIILTEQKQKE
ncbi:MAG: acyl-CoA-binding protein [Flavobacteriia bacterium]|nr:acyl-CoA-binding protein [Flavobacteriia bacterium]OIP48340.1 MAG: phosphatidylserine decarboxylase [Flavobacteriaceae bacterium CG2_30_31_66]PIV96287.1 MAG: phosphatidylserine decarboxylase [Flavobacteriaceae bacterium CG17_big_fil_post_rev_8_21_14_2_50_31_13]PIX12680.1 MAG: phosphatidylserine decarboxylase [Flavobacteriaceae bacterium CG_4_8_14_3_um_filter_31_8]PIY13547.1 MAG: phosphatidylserine decarboxylase [Flavobacteriaceae bacterium CG_4_10_14_3_um_filter_31_253]PIZ09424.1 MAG: phosp